MKKTNAARILDREKIEYKIVDYDVDPIELGASRVAHKTGQDIKHIYKTLVLNGDKTGVILACIPGDTELNLKNLAHISSNKKCAMLPQKDILNTTGYIRGGCSPLGMKKNFPLYIDHKAIELDHIYISAGLRGKQIVINPQDLIRISKACIADISQVKKEE